MYLENVLSELLPNWHDTSLPMVRAVHIHFIHGRYCIGNLTIVSMSALNHLASTPPFATDL